MNIASRRTQVFWRILYAAWGFATVVLVFVVGLLVYVLLQREQVPADPAHVASLAAPPTPQDVDQLVPTKEIDLYFADKQHLRLVAEKGQIEFTEFTSENCRRAIEALIRGPKGDLGPVAPPGSRIRGVYLLPDGELVVDFSLDLALEAKKMASASLEALLVYGIVNTVAQPATKGAREPAVTKVRILVEGSVRESFPVHLDVSAPFTPDLRWTTAAAE